MRQLFLEEEPLQIFFSESTSFTDIHTWIIEQVIFNKDNIFNLNEQHSCTVGPHERDLKFFIMGDEDLKTLTLGEIKTVI
jgi:hypothetical protein